MLYWAEYRVFGERLRRARRDAHLTQVEVTSALGKAQSWLSKCETGQRRVDAIELVHLARLYGKTLDWFLAKPTEHWVASRGANTSRQGDRRDAEI